MLGEQKSNFYTVKDVAPADFINAFAQYLKKNNLIERPKWADLVKTSTGNYLFIQPTSLPLLMMIGFTTELLLWLEKFTSDQELELNFYHISMVENTVSPADTQDTNTPA